MLKATFGNWFNTAMDLNRRNILDLIAPSPGCSLLDLGCDDGVWTGQLAARAMAGRVCGVEIVEERCKQAVDRGIEAVRADLNHVLPFDSNSFDIAHANQVIEHVADVDLFTSEIRRVLKPGGYAIISTENGSSWHNVFAAAMGWQIFSLTNMSSVALGVGNPLAIHAGGTAVFASWTHKTIFNFCGLREFCSIHGLSDPQVLGAGYYPLPAWIGRWDPRHAHFITVRAKKTSS